MKTKQDLLNKIEAKLKTLMADIPASPADAAQKEVITIKLNNMKTKQDLLNKIEAGVSQTAPWQKPIVLLIEDGDVYNDVFDTIREKYKTYSVVSEPKFNTFATVNDKFECLLNGIVVDAHKSDVDVYFYLEGYPLYDEVNLRYCVGLAKYENKPVISLICDVAENTPDWVYEEFEVLIIK